uniref:Putative helicase L207/L206 (Trinotate prediction) n=1 Tax=Henneguya salminicola TaxID=69463 RepID=A0A6G3MHF4_HENSL
MQIFPDNSVMELILNVLTAAIFPIQPPRHIYYCFGSGSNGKSIFFSLLSSTFEYMFGGLTSKFLTSTGERANSPSPMLLSLKNKRVIVNPETCDTPYCSSLLKRICSGGDWVNARQLYSAEIKSFVVMGRLFLSGNTLPKFDTYDQALRDRLVIVPF